jgi:hypothetical protein
MFSNLSVLRVSRLGSELTQSQLLDGLKFGCPTAAPDICSVIRRVENNSIQLLKVKGIGTCRAISFYCKYLKLNNIYKIELWWELVFTCT